MLKYFSLFLLFCFSSYAQDTIYFRSGQITPAKVTEIGVSEIKYYKSSNSEGPLYTESKNAIKKIKYSGNRTDTFSISVAKVNAPVLVPAYQIPGYQPIPSNLIDYRHGSYYMGNGERLSGEMILEMAESLAKTKKLLELKTLIYITRQNYRTKLITLPTGISCLGLALVCLEVGGLTYSPNSSGGILIACPLFAAAGITLMVMNGNNHKNYKKNLRKVVNMYNANAPR